MNIAVTVVVVVGLLMQVPTDEHINMLGAFLIALGALCGVINLVGSML